MIFTGITKENNNQGLEDYSLVYFFPTCLCNVPREDWLITFGKKKRSLKKQSKMQFIVFNQVNVAFMTAKELKESVDLILENNNNTPTFEYKENFIKEGERIYKEKYMNL